MATTQKRGTSYKITVSSGYDLSGKQIRHTMTWTPPDGMTNKQIQKEVNRQAVLFEEKVRTGQVLDGNIQFADFAELWFKEYAEKQLRPTTVAGYRKLTGRTYAVIGHIPLAKLQPHHLMSFYNTLAQPGVRANQSYHAKPKLKEFIERASLTTVAVDKLCGWTRGRTSKVINGAGLRHKNATLLVAALHQPITRLFEVPKQESCLSGNTLQHYHRFISSVLSTAVQWQVIFANPCERVAPPKRKRKEAQYLTLEQVAHLLELLQNEPEDMRCMITLLLYTGLRRSELLGLEWKDIDFQAGLLSIRRTSQYVAGKGVFTDETKTYHSRRVLKLTDTALTLLRQHHAVQMQNRLRLGDCWQEHDRIFTRWDGAPMNPNSLTHRFHTFIHQTDLPPVTIHSLRHTNATLLIAEGAGVKAVSSHLGHSSIGITGDLYAHSLQSVEAAAAEALENTLTQAVCSRRVGV